MFLRKNESVFHSFSLRLALIYTVALCFSLAAVLSATYQLVRYVVQERDHDVIQAQAVQYKALFSRGGLEEVSAYFNQQITTTSEQTFIRIVDAEDRVRFVTLSHPVWNLMDERTNLWSQLSSGISQWDELIHDESKGSWVVGTTPLTKDLYLQVGRSNTESRQVLAHFRKIAIRIILPAIVLSLLIGAFMTRSALTPLRSLIDTLRRILTTGDLKQRAPVPVQRGELGELTTMFNRMMDQNQQLVQKSRDTLDNVAHDLRTPMTHLLNAAEQALLDPAPDPEILKEALADCVEESEQILQMLDSLMDLAEADAGSMRLKKESVQLRELADEVIELYAMVAQEQQIELQNNMTAEVVADRLRLRQCLGNLIDNALKYSPKNTQIILSDAEEEGGVVLRVSDQGIGMTPEDLPRIWDRLYRGEQSRSTSGLGLGLSYVLSIVTSHGGTVDVKTRLNTGSTFILRLPHVQEIKDPEV